MSTYREKVESRLAGELLPGEVVREAVPAFRIGGVRKVMTVGAAGIGGLAAAAGFALATRQGRPEAPSVPIDTPSRFFLASSSRRVAVFTLGGIVKAAPGKLVHSWPLDRIAWITEPELVPGMAQALRVRIGIADEGVLGVEFPRLNVEAGRYLVKRLLRDLEELDQDGGDAT
ncbi:hypothetical protein VM98_24595 [Streptomyces rubellomurinus subsp. indigoferus]|nr:hypothetical protein VM98_24595 [Streptomyces rubellomurinus subsp. indigoferus]